MTLTMTARRNKILTVKWYSRLLPLMALVIFVSCEKEAVLELADSEGLYLIVEANLDDSCHEQWIRLSLSSSYYSTTQGEPFSNAGVIVSNGNTEYIFTESETDSLKGYYLNYQIGSEFVPGKYYLEIEYDGMLYSASTEYRPVPEIDSITSKLNFFSGIGLTDEILYDIFIHFRENKGEGDYYLVDVLLNDSILTSSPSRKTVLSDRDLEEYVSSLVFTIGEDNIKEGDSLRVELRSISKGNYEFYQIFFFQTDLSGNPFAGAPPANITTNLSNGARGYFQVSAVSQKSRIFKQSGIF